jgi:SAM-dependent methyltransferase
VKDVAGEHLMSKQNSQREYWSANLDVQNLGGGTTFGLLELSRELEYYFSPEQEYALAHLWGDEGPRRKRILEIGCGMGVFALFLARQDAEVYVVDIAPARLDFLRRQARALGLSYRIHIVCASAEALPFPEKYFDAVYTKSVLIHTQLEKSAAEAARVLKIGGMGVFVEPMGHNPFANIYRSTLAPAEWKEITTYFDRQRLGILAKAFGHAHVRFFYLFSFLAFFWQFGLRSRLLFKTSVRLLNAADSALFRAFPSLRRFAWFAVLSAKK